MKFHVVWTEGARTDLNRLTDHLLERELARDGGDLTLAEQAITTIEGAVDLMSLHPYTCRKVGDDPRWRELVITFGRAGYLAQFRIAGETLIFVTALQHQLEDDYH